LGWLKKAAYLCQSHFKEVGVHFYYYQRDRPTGWLAKASQFISHCMLFHTKNTALIWNSSIFFFLPQIGDKFTLALEFAYLRLVVSIGQLAWEFLPLQIIHRQNKLFLGFHDIFCIDTERVVFCEGVSAKNVIPKD